MNNDELAKRRKLCWCWPGVDPGEVLKTKTSPDPESVPQLTKEDYAYIYDCIDRTIQLAKLRSK